MLGLTVADVARLLGAPPPVDGARPLRSVVADSRSAGPGDLFVALTGARTDGHAHLEELAARGAVAALVRPGCGARPRDLAAIEVEDPLLALGVLARAHLQRLRPRVFGITGTVGKTTAKDFLAQLLGGVGGAVHAAPASFNSEIGLPLSVLGAPLGTRKLVLEYGINAPGEMERLLAIASPDEAWITAVSPVHLAGMGSLATIAHEKSLLAAAVPEAGRIWLEPAWSEVLRVEAARWQAPIFPLPGLEETGIQVRDTEPLAWRLDHPRWGTLCLPLVAPHEVALALGAAEIAAAQGVEPESLRARLAVLQRPTGRLGVHRYGALTLLDDSYNASPLSMEAALRTLSLWPRARRRVAVLGTMNELGAEAESLHRALGAHAARLQLDALACVGRGGGWIADAARSAGGVAQAFPDAESAATALAATLHVGDVVLLKASRGERLDRLIEPLARAATQLSERATQDAPRRAVGGA